MIDNLKLLAELWYRPVSAISAILDRGSLLFACVAVLAVSFALHSAAGLRAFIPFSFWWPLLVLAVAYIPGVLILATLFGRLGGLATVFSRDYSPLLTCVGMAWAATNAPLILAAWTGPPVVFLIVATLVYCYFAALVFFAVRTVSGVGNGAAAGAVALSWAPLLVAAPLSFVAGWLASPFFLFFAYYYLGGEISGLGSGLRARQHLRRTLEASTINPRDAEAQYQLGLIYQQRRQYSEAIQRFKNAVAIDPQETDAHFQLGRIARAQGRLNDALTHFQAVLDQNENHSGSEVLREIGAMYLTARQYPDAKRELDVYITRHPYDTEGLYYYGEALLGLGETAEARSAYVRAIESARMAPHFRRRHVASWSRLAQKRLRKLA